MDLLVLEDILLIPRDEDALNFSEDDLLFMVSVSTVFLK